MLNIQCCFFGHYTSISLYVTTLISLFISIIHDAITKCTIIDIAPFIFNNNTYKSTLILTHRTTKSEEGRHNLRDVFFLPQVDCLEYINVSYAIILQSFLEPKFEK